MSAVTVRASRREDYTKHDDGHVSWTERVEEWGEDYTVAAVRKRVDDMVGRGWHLLDIDVCQNTWAGPISAFVWLEENKR